MTFSTQYRKLLIIEIYLYYKTQTFSLYGDIVSTISSITTQRTIMEKFCHNIGHNSELSDFKLISHLVVHKYVTK